MAETPTIYTLDEVQKILKVTRRTLYTYIKSGKIKAVKIGREWRISEKELNRMADGMTTSLNFTAAELSMIATALYQYAGTLQGQDAETARKIRTVAQRVEGELTA